MCCINFEFVNLSKCFCLKGGGVNLLVMFCKRLKIFNLIRCWFFNDFNFEVFDLKGNFMGNFIIIIFKKCYRDVNIIK